MNGDGISDLVMRNHLDKLGYFPRKVIRNENNEPTNYEYEDFILMEIPGGLTSTYRGNSEGLNLNVGLTISSGIGNVSVGGSAGINKSWSNSKSNIFITDANGDYLPDLSVNNRILFNYIDFDDNNITKFSSSSDSTENLIVKGSEITVDPPETKVENEYKLPAFDVVKVWEALMMGRSS